MALVQYSKKNQLRAFNGMIGMNMNMWSRAADEQKAHAASSWVPLREKWAWNRSVSTPASNLRKSGTNGHSCGSTGFRWSLQLNSTNLAHPSAHHFLPPVHKTYAPYEPTRRTLIVQRPMDWRSHLAPTSLARLSELWNVPVFKTITRRTSK